MNTKRKVEEKEKEKRKKLLRKEAFWVGKSLVLVDVKLVMYWLQIAREREF